MKHWKEPKKSGQTRMVCSIETYDAASVRIRIKRQTEDEKWIGTKTSQQNDRAECDLE